MKIQDKHDFKNGLIDKFFKRMDLYIMQHSLLSIVIVYNAVILITCGSLYKLIPILLCYEENVRESSRAVNFSYDAQFIVGTLIAVVLSTCILLMLFKDIDEYKVLSAEREEDFHKLKNVRKKCMNIPYIIYICQICVPFSITVIISILGRIVLNISLILIFKLICVVFCFCFLSAGIAYTFSQRIFTRILFDTYMDSELEGFRIEIGTKILVQIIPMIITAVLITSLLGYSKLIDEKGDLLQETYKLQLEEELRDAGEIRDSLMLFQMLKAVKLDGIETTYFAVSPEGRIITTDGSSLPRYFTNFFNNPVKGYRVYGYTKEMQGTIKKVNIKGETWTAGIIFIVESPNTIKVFLLALGILIIVNAFLIYCFSKSISSDIAHVADNFMEIGRGGSIEDRRDIPVISNDEIGDLIIAFNKIQKLETEYDDMKNEFFANVSHELRTPLNIILISIQLLGSFERNNESNNQIKNIDRISEMIKQNSYRLLRLVNNLIDSSKIKASFYDVHMKNHDIVNVVEEISLSVANYIKEKNIEFIFDTEIEERIMGCDADMIERIMLNLLSNAVKFTGTGGNIFVNMHEENNNIIISVKDSGLGISKDEQKMIFERFKQVDKSLTRKREGSGIGLSLVKLLVEMHKGSIKVESEPGKGSEFIINLPVVLMNDPEDTSYLDKQIYSEKVENNIEKIKIEFSDIYF